MIFSENGCECSKILWYQFDFKSAIFVEVVTAYVLNTEKTENFNREFFKIKQFNFSKTPSVGVQCYVHYATVSRISRAARFCEIFWKNWIFLGLYHQMI